MKLKSLKIEAREGNKYFLLLGLKKGFKSITRKVIATRSCNGNVSFIIADELKGFRVDAESLERMFKFESLIFHQDERLKKQSEKDVKLMELKILSLEHSLEQRDGILAKLKKELAEAKEQIEKDKRFVKAVQSSANILNGALENITEPKCEPVMNKINTKCTVTSKRSFTGTLQSLEHNSYDTGCSFSVSSNDPNTLNVLQRVANFRDVVFTLETRS